MAARQFGLVVFRALAVYVFLSSLTQFNYLVVMYTGMQGAPEGFDFQSSQKAAATALWIAQILISAFLWTNAEKLAGKGADAQPTLRSGNWVVRLVFTAIGLIVCIYAIDSLVVEAAHLIVPDPIRRDRTREMKLSLLTDGIRLVIGLALIIAYRFDKRAAFSAAQAIEEPEP